METRTPSSSKSRPQIAVSLADPARRLATLEKQVERSLVRGESAAWDAGHHFDVIAKEMLYSKAPLNLTLEQYAEKRFPQGYSTLKRYRRIATAFTRATTRKHGVTKLYAGLLYMDLLPDHHRPLELLRLVIPVVRAGSHRPVMVPFVQATSTEIDASAQQARTRPSAHDDVREARLKRARNALQASVAAPKGTMQHAPGVRAHESDAGKLRFDVIAIDLEDLERVGLALVEYGRKHATARRPVRAARNYR
ncbi:MAG: hypothetical protein WCJ30_16775 [Deltaproteobacteria bacterium]